MFPQQPSGTINRGAVDAFALRVVRVNQRPMGEEASFTEETLSKLADS